MGKRMTTGCSFIRKCYC